MNLVNQYRQASRTLAIAFVCFVSVSTTSSVVNASTIESFDDVEVWFGSGQNESLLAIDFDGTSTEDQAVVWGYRWDSVTSVETLFRNVVGAEPRLFSKISNFGFGNAINGIGLDDGDGVFSLTDGTGFDQFGIFESSATSDGATAVNAGDQYAEGWFVDGFYNISAGDIDSLSGGSWTPAFAIGTEIIVDQGVYGFAFAPNFANNAFARNRVAPIPEPSVTAGLLLIAGTALARRKRRPNAKLRD